MVKSHIFVFLLLLLLMFTTAIPTHAQYDDFPEIPMETPTEADEGESTGLYIPEGYIPPPDDLTIDEDNDDDDEPIQSEPVEQAKPKVPAAERILSVETVNDAEKLLNDGGENENFGMKIDAVEPTHSGRIQEDEKPVDTDLSGRGFSSTTPEKPTTAGAVTGTSAEAEELFEKGTRCFNNREYDVALASFNKAIAIDPANDVYKLALDMVKASIDARGDETTEPTPTVASTNQPKPVKAGQPDRPTMGKPASSSSGNSGIDTGVPMLGDNIPAPRDNTTPKPRNLPKTISSQIKMVNLTLAFENEEPKGDLHFWKGRRCEILKTQNGWSAVLDKGKGFSDFAIGFTIPGQPVKAVAIVTHCAETQKRSFYPLRISANKAEMFDGTAQLLATPQLHRFNISKEVRKGINYLRFSINNAPAEYQLQKVTIFLQYKGYNAK